VAADKPDGEEKIRRALRDIERDIALERERVSGSTSAQFKKYLQEEVEARGKLNWYERLCRAMGNIVRIDPGKKSREKMDEDILISGLRVTPDEVSSLVLTTMLLFFIMFLPLMIFVQSGDKYFIPIIGVAISYYFLTYPRYIATLPGLDTLRILQVLRAHRVRPEESDVGPRDRKVHQH
jgi:hypothetical protein